MCIRDSNIVVDSDRAGGAALLALAAGNTAHAAGLTGYSTLGLGRAAYIDLAGLGIMVIRPLGQALAHAPQAMQFSGSTTATPSTMWMASY